MEVGCRMSRWHALARLGKDLTGDRVNKGELAGQFSSNTGLWETPDWLFDELNEEFGFDLDVCALPENAKCSNYYTPEQDAFRQDWRGRCWMNPPYGREIGRWLQKALDSTRRGALVVCLLPARTDTGWWHQYVMQADEIRFIRGRIYFKAPLGFQNKDPRTPFPSAIAVFRPGDDRT